jgi:tetraacyldisaccharide 4'-kinase
MELLPETIYNIADPKITKTTVEFMGRIVHAVSGIGNPAKFFQSLRQMGMTVAEHVFPDHYYFTPHDINFGSESIVIMTEKDAVKCKSFADARHWCLPVNAKIDSKFGVKLLAKLQQFNSVKDS